MGADASVDQPAVEARRLRRSVDGKRVFLYPWYAEIIDLAANGDDQRIIGKLALGRDLAAFLIEHAPDGFPAARDQGQSFRPAHSGNGANGPAPGTRARARPDPCFRRL